MNAIGVFIPAARKLGITLTAVLLLPMVLRPAKGAEIVVTITGKLMGGDDLFPIFDVGKALDKKPFTLVFTFDDSKGRPTPLARCPGSASGTTGKGGNSPGKAVLTIGSKSYTFGMQKDSESNAWREINSGCSRSLIVFDINEGDPPLNSIVNIRMFPADKRRSLTQDADWRAPLSTSDMAGYSNLSGFVISRAGDYQHEAKSFFFFESITIKKVSNGR